MMKKTLLATVLVAAGSALATVPAVPANAGTADPFPCGFYIDAGRAYYTNCSEFNAGIRIVHSNGQLTTACVLGRIMIYLGQSYDITNAYTYKTC